MAWARPACASEEELVCATARGGQHGAPGVTRAAHTPGLYFLCLSSAQKVLAERWPRDGEGAPALPHVRTFALGAFSRATAAVVFCPITVVKTRMVRVCCVLRRYA